MRNNAPVAIVVAIACSLAAVGCGGGTSTPSPAKSDVSGATESTLNEKSGLVAISKGGNEVSYRCSGSGEPVILLEAGDDTGGSQAYGPSIIDPLANHTTTCIYDRPGTGTSDPARGRRRTLASYRTDLNAFLHAANLAPPYLLVGQSGGGNLLISYASAHADDVAGLVLIETYHDDPVRLAKEIDPFDPATATGEKFDTMANVRALDKLALPLGDFPVLVMTATDADPGNQENQAYWLEISPDSRQVVITGSHELHDDDPDRVTNEILRTLDDIRNAS
jgi:pimeloyl-ACP methyl ester carboxylesterase